MQTAEQPDRAAWGALFAAAFNQSRNAMALLDEERRYVEVNGAYLKLLGFPRAELIGRPHWELVPGGPVISTEEWRRTLLSGHFTGEARIKCADGGLVAVQWAATTEIVTGRRLVLFVALSTSRWGASFRREPEHEHLDRLALTAREREIVRLVAMGSTAREIADELLISHDTVRTHVRNAMVKSGARSRAQLVAQAIGEGLALN